MNYIYAIIPICIFAIICLVYLLNIFYLKYKKTCSAKEFTNDQVSQFNKEKSDRYSNMQNKVNIESTNY
jgi:hypothetical protein